MNIQMQIAAPIVQQSQAATQVILSLFAFFQGIKRLVSVVGVWFLILISLPLLPFFLAYLWILFFRLRLKLSKYVRPSIDITDSNYTQLRREYDALLLIDHKVKSSGLDMPKGLGKNFLNLMQISAMIGIFKARVFALETAFHSLDPKTTLQNEFLIPVSENELWNNRTKAYNYLV